VIVGLSPSGEIAGPPETFIWTRDPRARSYRFELRDAEGNVLCSRVTSDTMLVVSGADVRWGSSAGGSWTVAPTTEAGEGASSDAVHFEITPR
jgi:hypothetical protein